MMNQRIVHLFATSLALSFVVTAAQAPASPSRRDPAAADALFRAALDARDKGDWGTACKKFKASMELDPAASTLINIAKCHEHEGKLATAWADINRAMVLNRETAGEQRREELAHYGKGLIANLEPRLPKLKIIIHSSPGGLEIKRNGVDVSTALGDPLPVDPGVHEIEATARGYVTEKRTVQVAEKQTLTVELSLVKDVTSPRRVTAYVVGGVGLAGLVLGGVTGAMVIYKGSVIEKNCGEGAGFPIANACNKTGHEAFLEAMDISPVSTIGFGVGAAGVVTAAILLATERKRAPVASRGFHLGVLTAGRDSAIFGIRGEW